MLRAARAAPTLLRDARPGVIEFLHAQFNADGGVRDRAGASDLYYTVFAVDALCALEAEVPVELLTRYLRTFGDGAELDLVHLACLARCWSAVEGGTLDRAAASCILQRIETHRSGDGGYARKPHAVTGAVYDCFLGLGAYQDLGTVPPDGAALGRCVLSLQTADGAFGSEHTPKLGTTPTTAAAIVLLHELGVAVPQTAADWLLARARPDGGFAATPVSPLPDLLSTGTAVHALATVDRPLAELKEPCLDFLDSLWTGRAFRGHWADEFADCEYTFYALLALGHLGADL